MTDKQTRDWVLKGAPGPTMFMVCTDEGKVPGVSAGSAHAILPTRAAALRFILEHGMRRVAYVEPF